MGKMRDNNTLIYNHKRHTCYFSNYVNFFFRRFKTLPHPSLCYWMSQIYY